MAGNQLTANKTGNNEKGVNGVNGINGSPKTANKNIDDPFANYAKMDKKGNNEDVNFGLKIKNNEFFKAMARNGFSYP